MRLIELLDQLNEHRNAYLYNERGQLLEMYDGRNSFSGKYDDCKIIRCGRFSFDGGSEARHDDGSLAEGYCKDVMIQIKEA